MSSSNKRTSAIWAYFTVKDPRKKVAQCHTCGRSMNYSATISNLKKHYERRHPHIRMSEKNAIQTVNIRMSENNAIKTERNDNCLAFEISSPDLTSNGRSVSESPTSPIAQSTSNSEENCVVPTISSLVFPPEELNETQKLDKLLMRLFFYAYQPFSLVEDDAFVDFVNSLNASYNLPSKKIVTSVMIPDEYNKCLSVVRQEFFFVESVCLSIEVWTSENQNSYLNVITHYITEAFELRSIFLECSLLPVSPTSAYLAELIQGITKKFNIADKLSVVISNNDCSISDAVTKELKKEHFTCFAHVFNLILKDALNTAKELIDKINTIVIYFKRNSPSLGKLNTAQKMTFGLEPKKLVQEDATRWNSTFYMIQRFSELQDAIKTTVAVINSDLPVLSEEEWAACKELSILLEPFEEATEEICDEHYVKGSVIIPLTNGLRSVCKTMQNEQFGSIAKGVIEEIINGLDTKMVNIEENKSLAMATFLDPRFKLVPFSSESTAQSIKEYCASLMADVWTSQHQEQNKMDTDVADPNSSQMDTSTNSSVGRLVKFSLWENLDRKIASKKSSDSMSAAMTEINRYLEDNFLGRKEDPLLWWKKNQFYYPLMTKLVKTKFNIVGTSLPCERLFTKAGNLTCERRSRLKAKYVKELLFLNANSFLVS